MPDYQITHSFEVDCGLTSGLIRFGKIAGIWALLAVLPDSIVRLKASNSFRDEIIFLSVLLFLQSK